MDLGNIMLREIKLTEKNKNVMVSLTQVPGIGKFIGADSR